MGDSVTRQLLLSMVFLMIVGASPGASFAQLMTQHVKGAVGLKAGSQPPPGRYVPVGANNRIQGTEIDANPGAGFTDSAFTPISLGWHRTRADFITAFNLFAPTGKYTNYGFVTVRYFWVTYARTTTQGSSFLISGTLLTKPIMVPGS